MVQWLAAAAIGFASGVLSGMFGIGGGIITTPAIRLLLGAPALVAVGTPLPVILPGALTGANEYRRRGLTDTRAGLAAGLAGVLSAVLGAWATRWVGGSVVLVGTAVLIAWAAADTVLQAVRPVRATHDADSSDAPEHRLARAAGMGALAGLYSGFFGLGGGFVLVPMLTRWLRLPMKRAVGTSLVAVAVLAVPGTVTHAVLGNVDWGLAAGLVLGVVPGAWVGARVTSVARDVHVRLGFAALLISLAIWLAASELLGLS